MANIKTWIQASRPRTLVVSASSVLTGTAVAICYGHFHLWTFFHCLLLGFSIQIMTNLANDYFDFKKGSDTKDRIGPTRVMQAGLASERAMISGMLLTCLLGGVSTLYLISIGGIWIGYLFALAIALAIGYTAGPIAIAYLGLGEVFTLVFWGMVPTGMTTYLQTGDLTLTPFLAGLAPGAMATAILIMNNLRDYEEDLRASKHTLVVRFGRIFGKIEYLAMIALAYLSILYLWLFCNAPPRLIFSTLSFFFCIPLLKELKKASVAQDFLVLFPKTAAFFVVYSFFYVWGWIL